VAVQKLATTGAKMVIISNSSRRASTTMEKMKILGFDTSLFLGAITSGELTHQYLQRLVIQLYGVEELCSMFGVVLVIEKSVAFLCLYGINFVF
jgi:ribonucleotide monophosphatase NagD (HAD superfamily)